MILVTGGTGTVGSALVKILSQSGQKLRVLSRDPKKAAHAGPNVEVVKGDLSDPSTLDAAFKGVDKLFLLTNSNEGSVKLQSNALAAAKKAGVKHVVRLSVLGADLQSPVQLSRWHAQTDAELQKSGMAWTILRPGYFMQNFLGSAGSIKDRGAFYGAMKQGKAAMIDARDIAAAAAKALTVAGHEGKIYELTGPEAISQDEAAAKLGAATGKPVKYVDLPPDQFKKGLTGAGVPEWLANDFVTMHTAFATGGASTIAPGVEQLTGTKGHRFDQFAKDFAGAFKA